MQRKYLMTKWPIFRMTEGVAAVILGLFCSTASGELHAQGSNAPASTHDGLPLLGDGSDMPSAAERRLGDRIIRELYRDPDYIDDPVLGDYVQSIWQPLLSAARQRGDLTAELDERFAWTIVLGKDRTVNAFALPGGYLGVHLGLLAVVSSPDELASVLAHELSHVTQRHISRMMSKSRQQAPWMLGAMILGALAASKSPDAGGALIVGGQAAAIQGQLNFSRDMEREADRLGFGVMTQAGFQAEGFVSMFDKLQQASRHNDSGNFPYLRSHPLTTERIADMNSRLPLGAPQQATTAPTLSHAMMSTRARVLSNPGVDDLRSWQAQVDVAGFDALPAHQQVAKLYGATLAASQLRDLPVALRNLRQLQTLCAAPPLAAQQVRWLGMEIALAHRDPGLAQRMANSPDVMRFSLGPTAGSWQRTELLLQAQIAQQTAQNQALNQSAQQLQTWLTSHPKDALAWQTVASIYTLQNQPLRALRAEAEVFASRLDYAGALDRLRAAQERVRTAVGPDTVGGHIDASIIDTRSRQLQALLKEQSLGR